MPLKFKIQYLVTGVLNAAGTAFTDINRNDTTAEVARVHDLDGPKPEVKLGEEFDYGTTLLAGEPCANDPTRTILYLRIVRYDTATPNDVTPVMKFSYRTKPQVNVGILAIRFDDPTDPPPDGWVPDPDTDPYIAPDPESPLPDYEQTTNDDTEPVDDPEEPPCGESSDCDGTIGIGA